MMQPLQFAHQVLRHKRTSRLANHKFVSTEGPSQMTQCHDLDGCKCGAHTCFQGQQCHESDLGCRGQSLATDNFGDSAVGWNSADTLRELVMMFMKGLVAMWLLVQFLGKRFMMNYMSQSQQSFHKDIFGDENTKFQFCFFFASFFLWASGAMSMLGYSSEGSHKQTAEENWNDVNGKMLTQDVWKAFLSGSFKSEVRDPESHQGLRDIDSWMTTDFQANFINDIVDVAWGFMSMLVMGKVMEANIDAGHSNDLENGGLGHFLFSVVKSQSVKDMGFQWVIADSGSIPNPKGKPIKKKPFIMFYNENGSSIPFQIQKDDERKKAGKQMDPFRKQCSRGKRFFARQPGGQLLTVAIDNKPKMFFFQLPPADPSSSDPARRVGNAIIVVTEDGDVEHQGLEDWKMICEEKENDKTYENSDCKIQVGFGLEYVKKDKKDSDDPKTVDVDDNADDDKE